MVYVRKWILLTHTNKTNERKSRLTHKQRAAIVADMRQGLGTKALAERFGVSEQTIRRITRDAKVARIEAKTETAVVGVRVPVEDIRAFDVVISRLGDVQKSDALRAFVRHPAGFLGADGDLADAIRDIKRELVAIGTNVNQIARRLNDPRLQPKDRKLTKADGAVLRDVRDCVNAAREQITVLSGKKARDRDAAFRAIVTEASGGA